MKCWFLEHSGVAVKTQQHLLLFDLFGKMLDWESGKGLAQGVVNPQEIGGEDVLAFVSHEHEDHFSTKLFELSGKIGRFRMILPEELDALTEDAVFVRPNETVELPDCRITTLESTDIGVAYLIEIDGKLIYHAGDLNWWHWEGEEEAFNRDQAQRYQQQMEKLKQAVGERSIDVAFVPVDPRLNRDMLRGVCCLAEHVSVNRIVPIHFWGDFSVCRQLADAPQAAAFANRVVELTACGQEIEC